MSDYEAPAVEELGAIERMTENFAVSGHPGRGWGHKKGAGKGHDKGKGKGHDFFG